MTAPSNANTSGLEVVAFLMTNRRGHTSASTMPPADGGDVAAYEPLVTAASAQARIAELEAENDVLKVEVIGLRAAIFGSHDYDPSLRHGNFVEMARATEDGRQGALDRATAAEARADRLAKALETLEAERKRDGVNLAHLKRAIAVAYADMNRAALQQETQK